MFKRVKIQLLQMFNQLQELYSSVKFVETKFNKQKLTLTNLVPTSTYTQFREVKNIQNSFYSHSYTTIPILQYSLCFHFRKKSESSFILCVGKVYLTKDKTKLSQGFVLSCEEKRDLESRERREFFTFLLRVLVLLCAEKSSQIVRNQARSICNKKPKVCQDLNRKQN